MTLLNEVPPVRIPEMLFGVQIANLIRCKSHSPLHQPANIGISPLIIRLINIIPTQFYHNMQYSSISHFVISYNNVVFAFYKACFRQRHTIGGEAVRFRDLREDMDMTQQALAEILHIRQSTLSQYETGQRQIPLGLLIRMALFFDTSTDYLLGLTNERRPYPRVRQHAPTGGSAVRGDGAAHSLAFSNTPPPGDRPSTEGGSFPVWASGGAFSGGIFRLFPAFSGHIFILPIMLSKSPPSIGGLQLIYITSLPFSQFQLDKTPVPMYNPICCRGRARLRRRKPNIWV